MTSEQIINLLELYAKLMELHGGNAFKVKAFQNAAYKLDKSRFDFSGKTIEELNNIEGIGKGITGFIMELLQKGSSTELNELLSKTPEGVVAMLHIKGLGPKKVASIWKELHVESPSELLYACNENRLVSLKGFGLKTQQAIIENIRFMQANASGKHFAMVEVFAEELLQTLQNQFPEARIEFCGDYRRKCEVLDKLEIISDTDVDTKKYTHHISFPVEVHVCHKETFVFEWFKKTATAKHLEKINFSSLNKNIFSDENEIYRELNLPYIEPELREGLAEVELARKGKLPELIKYTDLKGALHNHSTYSDGANTISEMANRCIKLGLQYLGICDHSRSAAYAGGLSIERVQEQWNEINKLNQQYSNFRVLKGIESDILSDGSLDYPEEILSGFDFVVASIHSNLKMDEEKANARLIKAIENPYTNILGHPTGRLLLARPGYPINHKKIIDACAANKVHIELNAHPYRLDIDWRWIYYCVEKGVKVSINPDAHHVEGLNDMKYGVFAARKGLLSAENCLNALELSELINSFSKK